MKRPVLILILLACTGRLASATPPLAPTFAAEALPFGAGLSMTWTAALTFDAPLGGTQIEASSNGITFTTALVAAPWATRQVMSLACGQALTLQARAFDALGNSGPASATEWVFIPCAPQLMAGALNAGQMTVYMAPGSGTAGSSVELRSTTFTGATWALSTALTATASNLTHAAATVSDLDSLWFKAYAYGPDGVTSAASAEVAVLAPPAGLAGMALTQTAVISWPRPSTMTAFALSGFELRYGSDPTLTVNTAATLPDPSPAIFTSVTLPVASGTDLYYAVATRGGSPGVQRGRLSAIQKVQVGLSRPRIVSVWNEAGTALALSWSASSDGAAPVTYTVYSAATLGGVGTAVTTTTLTSLSNLAAVAGTAFYRVLAVDNASVQSPLLPPASEDVTITALAAPTGLAALLGTRRVSLSWNTVVGADTYQVYRATFGLPSTPAWVSSTAWVTTGLSLVDMAPVYGTSNAYLVEAQKSLSPTGGASVARSTSVAVLPWVAPGLPGRITRTASTGFFLTATADTIVPTTVNLAWEPAELGSTLLASHEIKRGSNPDPALMSPVATVPMPLTYYADTGVLGSLASLFYAIRGVDLSSTAGAWLTGTVSTLTPALGTVTLTASALDGAVYLSWTPNAGAIHYKVYRSTAALPEPMSNYVAEVQATASGVTLTVDDVSQPWNYYVAVSTSAGLGLASSSTLSVFPRQAQGLNATAAYSGGSQINLAWSYPAVAVPTSFRVYRSLDSSTWTLLGSSGAPAFSDNTVAVNTPYYYQVRSVGTLTSLGGPIVGPVRAYGPPTAPLGLRASGSTLGIDLSWNAPDPSEGVTGHLINTIDYLGNTLPVSQVAGTQYSYRLLSSTATVPLGLGINFRVQALNSAGASALSLPVTASVQTQGPAAGPKGVKVLVGHQGVGTGNLEAVLSWTSDTSGALAQIYRSNGSMNFGAAQGGSDSLIYLTTVSAALGRLTDTAVTANTPYEYALSFALPGQMPWGESPPVSGGLVRPYFLPGAVTLTAAAADGRVDLAWTPAQQGTYALSVLPYRLYRYRFDVAPAKSPVLGDSNADLRRFDLNATAYTDLDVLNGKIYYYLLTVIDVQGHETTLTAFPRQEAPNQALAKALVPQGPRRPPSALSALPGDAGVSLVWVARAIDAQDGVKFNVYRRLQSAPGYSGPLPHLFKVGPESTAFGSLTQVLQSLRDVPNAASILLNKVTYCYTMAAVNEWGEGPKSQEICVTPFRALDPRLDASAGLTQDPRLNLVPQGSKDVALSWLTCRDQNPAEGYALAGYRVYRSNDGGTTYALLTPALLLASAQSYVDTTTKFGVGYVYRVVPVDDFGNEGLAYTLAYRVIPASQQNVLLYKNAFNPAKGESLPWQVMVQEPGKVWVKVYTLAGEAVVTLFDQEVAQASPNQPYLSDLKRWDGRNAQGQVVASGVYVVHVQAPGFKTNARVAVIK